jgi:hypothetical protein
MASKPKSFRVAGRPDAQERERQYDRERNAQRPWRKWYFSNRWKKARATFLAEPENQFCRRCEAAGLLNPGTMRPDGTLQTDPKRMHLVVHHTVRHRGDPVLFWDADLWEPICPDHHDSDAQAEERAAFPRR